LVDYFKVKELLLNLLIEACNIKEPRSIYRDWLEPHRIHFINPPFRFTMEKFDAFQKQQGLVSIRISNGSKIRNMILVFYIGPLMPGNIFIRNLKH
jgi:hypothetical protein